MSMAKFFIVCIGLVQNALCNKNKTTGLMVINYSLLILFRNG